MKSKYYLFNIRSVLAILILTMTLSILANSIFLKGAGEILKTPMASQAFSRLFEISQTHLSAMSSMERGRLLKEKLDTLEQQGEQELAADIDNLFFNISQQQEGIERTIERLITRIPREKISIHKFLDNSTKDSLKNIFPNVKMISLPRGYFSVQIPWKNKEEIVVVEVFPFEIMDAPV